MSSSTTARFSVIPLLKTVERLKAPPQEQCELRAETDEELLCRVRSDKRDALALLFRRYARLTHAIGQRVLRNTAEADDLVQEVFLYIHRKSALYDSGKGTARSWIVQVSYTQALLRRRRLKSQGFYASAIEDKSQEPKFQSKSEAEYDQTVEGLFGRNGWRGALEALTPDQSETLRLHFFEGYTFAEIAEKLDQSYVSIRHHHYRGLEKLRKHLIGNELSRR